MNFKIHITLLIIIINLIGCSSKKIDNNKLDQSLSGNCLCYNDIYSNRKVYITEYSNSSVLIGDNLFTIKIVRDKYSNDSKPYNFKTENWWENNSPSTILIYKNSNCELVYFKKYEGVKISFSKISGTISDKGNLYMNLLSLGGGSGYTSWISKIDVFNDRIRIQQLFDSNELSVILFNKKDNEIILLNGIWDMSGWNEFEDGEDHFSEHRYEVIKYIFDSNKVKHKKLGKTNLKYLLENKTPLNLFNEIKSNENLKFSKYPINHYKTFNNWTGEFE